MSKIIDLFKKISRTPTWIMGALVMLTCFFSDAYNILYSAKIVCEQFFETGSVYSGANLTTLIVSTCIMQTIFTFAIFELVINMIYRFMAIRGMVNSNKKFFVQTSRAIYIVTNIIIGLYSLANFASPTFNLISGLVLNYLVQIGAITFGFIVFSWSVINPFALKDAFARVYMYYFMFVGIFTGLNLIGSIGSTEIQTLEIIMYAVRLVLVIGTGALAHFVLGKKIKARCDSYIPPRQEEPIKNPFDNFQDISDIFNFNNVNDQNGTNSTQENSRNKQDDNDEIFPGHGF